MSERGHLGPCSQSRAHHIGHSRPGFEIQSCTLIQDWQGFSAWNATLLRCGAWEETMREAWRLSVGSSAGPRGIWTRWGP